MPYYSPQQQRHQDMASESRYRFIVGLDYGTTYSGLSFVTSNKKTIEDIEVVNEWPRYPFTVWKAPSRIAYASENKNLSTDTWGFSVNGNHKSYSWTKLLLDRDALAAAHDDPSLRDVFGEGMLALPPNKTAQAVCQDYLRCMHDHLVSLLQKRVGESMFNLTPMECWITVPAIWSDKATALTLQAAKDAGFASRDFDSINVIQEPEAAALTVLKPHLGADAVNPVRPGEDIMVCDCGGGTVDIVTYKIIAVSPYLEFQELHAGIGGKCGSTYIDRNFIAWMTETFGENFTSLAPNRRGPSSDFMRSFEMAKRSFGSPEPTSSYIEIRNIIMATPYSDVYDDDDQCVKLPTSQMEAFFKPVVTMIISLIEDQLVRCRELSSCNLKRLVLVGGFGESAFLNSELNKWCRENGGVELTCPMNCQAAIVKGAALRGLGGFKPQLRRLRRHYGYVIRVPFRDGIDPPAKKRISYWDRAPYCDGVMNWTFVRGQQVNDSTETRNVLTSEFLSSQKYDACVTLYECPTDEAPGYSDHPNVKCVGRITVSFKEDDMHLAKTRFSKSRMCQIYQVQYTLVMKIVQTELRFSVLIDGVERGTANISFD